MDDIPKGVDRDGMCGKKFHKRKRTVKEKKKYGQQGSQATVKELLGEKIDASEESEEAKSTGDIDGPVNPKAHTLQDSDQHIEEEVVPDGLTRIDRILRCETAKHPRQVVAHGKRPDQGNVGSKIAPKPRRYEDRVSLGLVGKRVYHEPEGEGEKDHEQKYFDDY